MPTLDMELPWEPEPMALPDQKKNPEEVDILHQKTLILGETDHLTPGESQEGQTGDSAGMEDTSGNQSTSPKDDTSRKEDTPMKDDTSGKEGASKQTAASGTEPLEDENAESTSKKKETNVLTSIIDPVAIPDYYVLPRCFQIPFALNSPEAIPIVLDRFVPVRPEELSDARLHWIRWFLSLQISKSLAGDVVGVDVAVVDGAEGGGLERLKARMMRKKHRRKQKKLRRRGVGGAKETRMRSRRNMLKKRRLLRKLRTRVRNLLKSRKSMRRLKVFPILRARTPRWREMSVNPSAKRSLIRKRSLMRQAKAKSLQRRLKKEAKAKILLRRLSMIQRKMQVLRRIEPPVPGSVKRQERTTRMKMRPKQR